MLQRYQNLKKPLWPYGHFNTIKLTSWLLHWILEDLKHQIQTWLFSGLCDNLELQLYQCMWQCVIQCTVCICMRPPVYFRLQIKSISLQPDLPLYTVIVLICVVCCSPQVNFLMIQSPEEFPLFLYCVYVLSLCSIVLTFHPFLPPSFSLHPVNVQYSC